MEQYTKKMNPAKVSKKQQNIARKINTHLQINWLLAKTKRTNGGMRKN